LPQNRRHFLKSVGSVALWTTAAQQRAFALRFHSEGLEWARELRRMSDQLLLGQITPDSWQQGVSDIYRQTDFAQLLQSLDFEAVRRGMEIRNNSGTWLSIFVDGLSQRTPHTIHTKIVGMHDGRAVPPHGHENEVSAFLTLDGSFRVRQWDRVALHEGSMDIRAYFDGMSRPGEWNSQSEESSNVHWLIAQSSQAYFLSVRVCRLDGTLGGRDRIPIDPDGAEHLGHGVYRAAIMDSDAWWEKYR
jgi:hypothetical protein